MSATTCLFWWCKPLLNLDSSLPEGPAYRYLATKLLRQLGTEPTRATCGAPRYSGNVLGYSGNLSRKSSIKSITITRRTSHIAAGCPAGCPACGPAGCRSKRALTGEMHCWLPRELYNVRSAQPSTTRRRALRGRLPSRLPDRVTVGEKPGGNGQNTKKRRAKGTRIKDSKT